MKPRTIEIGGGDTVRRLAGESDRQAKRETVKQLQAARAADASCRLLPGMVTGA